MKRARFAPLCALLVTSLSACGGGKDGAAKELDALRAEIVKLRTETAMLADRVGALERPSSKRAVSAPAAEAAPKDADRPPLEVVRLEPSPPRSTAGSSPSDQDELALLGDAALDEDEDEPRPVLRSGPGGAVVAEKPSALPAGAKAPKAIGAARPGKAEVPR